ncbi:hypothetical protein LQ327_23070 [Actinomycetospora endophytica]|uniref:Uncharacterized protein n=1 Tax=Actinomycetospora endophytica TaxID=2291215 RepID=A0ABS8PDB6_9PSEU|nr:hypothetical protein [Actinomycetospora endophytica]MCD2196261.1 hypothetical protein [Actinomycetospora endophytica]
MTPGTDLSVLDDPPLTDTTLSDWLRDHDVTALAEVARSARLAGGSFGRHLRALA